MKKPYLTIGNIRRAVAFVERRKAHAKETGNEEWASEFENVARIIRGLCALDVDGDVLKTDAKNTDAGKREGR